MKPSLDEWPRFVVGDKVTVTKGNDTVTAKKE